MEISLIGHQYPFGAEDQPLGPIYEQPPMEDLTVSAIC